MKKEIKRVAGKERVSRVRNGQRIGENRRKCLETEARKRNNLKSITNGKEEKRLQMKCRELEKEITCSFQAG